MARLFSTQQNQSENIDTENINIEVTNPAHEH